MALVMLFMNPGISWGLANPAAAFCVKRGGRVKFARGRAGNTEFAFFEVAVSWTSGLTFGQ